MNAKQRAGQIGGRKKSPAKAAAVRLNGKSGGRPSRAVRLMRKVQAAHKELAPRLPQIDPGDLSLILECLFREPGSGRQFFIFERKQGGYAF